MSEQVRHAMPAMRIFVFGYEASLDVSTCTMTLADGREPNTAKFTLVNPFDRYIMTDPDIAAINPKVDLSITDLPDVLPTIRDFGMQNTAGVSTGLTSIEAIQRNLTPFQSSQLTPQIEAYVAQTQSTVDNIHRQIERNVQGIADEVKRQVLKVKTQPEEFIKVSQPNFSRTGTQPVTSLSEVNALRGYASRYPLQSGDCIFHSNDPVRIFWRDPFNPDVWYHMFSGFISDITDDIDENNQKVVTIGCEDATRILRYARIVTNPGIFDINYLKQIEDAAIQTFYNNAGFANLTLPEVMYTLLFGSDVAGTTDRLQATSGSPLPPSRPFINRRVAYSGAATGQGTKNEGVGSFDFDRSITFVFGPSSDAPEPGAPGSSASAPRTPTELLAKEVSLTGADALAVYQAVIDHQVRVSDLRTMVLKGETPLSTDNLVKDPRTLQPLMSEVIRVLGTNPQLYPVDSGRLILLMPASLGPDTNRNVLWRDIIPSVATQTTFRNRLATIYDILEHVEFSFYASPRGDLICEMPLYDFDPDDFGAGPQGVTQSDVTQQFEYHDGAPVGSLAASVGFEAGEVRGPFGPHYNIARRDTIRSARSFVDSKVRTQYAVGDYALQAYQAGGTQQVMGQPPGVATLRALIPQFGVRFEQAEPYRYVASAIAAQTLAALKLNQNNADARSSNVEMLPNLRMWPNRPLKFTERNYIATLRSVEHTLVWGQDMTMNVGVNYLRGWDGLYKPNSNQPLYVPLGGLASRTMNYAILFRTGTADAPSSGNPAQDGPGTAPATPGAAAAATARAITTGGA